MDFTALGLCLLIGGIALGTGIAWAVTVRTSDYCTRLEHQHEDDQHSIRQLQRSNHRIDHELRRERATSAQLVSLLHQHGIDVTLPIPRAGVLDERQPGGAR